MSALVDLELKCCERNCEGVFIFTAGEQAFYTEKNLSPPRRCPPCRAARRASKEAGNQASAPAPVIVETFVSYDDRGGAGRRGRGSRGGGGGDDGDFGRGGRRR